eukprot:8423286-Pyramimonas_sp.AAC.1
MMQTKTGSRGPVVILRYRFRSVCNVGSPGTRPGGTGSLQESCLSLALGAVPGPRGRGRATWGDARA